MREILFKAKRIDNGEWTEGYYECDPDLDIHYICGFNYYSSENGLEREFFNDEVNKETICQYTGLTDKNGNKIWENDVVRKSDINALGYGRIRNCEVSFDKLGFWLLTTEYGDGYWLGSFDAAQLEVIGTTFDNLELLENE